MASGVCTHRWRTTTWSRVWVALVRLGEAAAAMGRRKGMQHRLRRTSALTGAATVAGVLRKI